MGVGEKGGQKRRAEEEKEGRRAKGELGGTGWQRRTQKGEQGNRNLD